MAALIVGLLGGLVLFTFWMFFGIDEGGVRVLMLAMLIASARPFYAPEFVVALFALMTMGYLIMACVGWLFRLAEAADKEG